MKKIKLTKTNGSFKCVLPKDFVTDLGWKDKDILSVRKHGGKIILELEVKDENK